MKPLWPRCWILVLASGILAVAPVETAASAGETPAQPPSDSTVEDIVRAWRQREERLRSGRFVWTQSKLQFVTERPSSDGDIRTGDDSKGKADVPKREVQTDTERQFAFDGRMWRYSRSGPTVLADTGGTAPSQYVLVWNGECQKTFTGVGPSSKSGQVHAEPTLLRLQDIIPLLLFSRPVSLYELDFAGTDSTVKKKVGVVQGRKCVVIEEAKLGMTREYWVDPSRDFVVVRYISIFNKQTFVTLDIQYAEDLQHGWVPSGWKAVIPTPSGGILQSWEAVVTQYEMNPKISPEQFQYQFPVDTWVNDFIADAEYIVRKDQQRRPILKEELARGATYRDLLQSESGAAKLGGETAGTHWVAVSIVSGLFLVVGVWLVFRLRRRSAG